MRVLLVSTNQLKPSKTVQWVPVVPLGLAYVASALRRSGHTIELLDLCFVDDLDEEILRGVERLRPEVIGISFRNIEMMASLNNISFLGDLKRIVGVCRKHSSATIIMGGSGFSIMPEDILEFTGCELGIAGEGESSLPELLSRLERNEDYSDVPGVVSTRGGKVSRVPPARNRELGVLAPPARDLIDHRRYMGAGGTANLQTKRGCPFGCIYCTYPLIEGTEARCMPPPNVAAEFRLLYEEYRINELYIVDSQFNYPPDHAKAICEELISMRDTVKVWWSCMINPGHMSEELALMLRLARCVMADLGIESASDAMLRNLGKNFTVRDIRETIGLLRKCKLPFNTWILLGGPGENERTVRETCDFLVEMDVPNVLFSIGIRICPGTKLERLMQKEGRMSPGTKLLDPVFCLSMDARKIANIVEPYCVGRGGWHIAALKHPDDA